MEQTLYTVKTSFRVEFFDVDSMQIAWHGNYVKYMEIGRCALLDEIGYGYKEMVADGYVFPVTTMNLKFVRSLHFGETATIETSLVEYENRLKIKYVIYTEDGQVANKAESTQMCVRASTNESLFECPPLLLERVEKLIGPGHRQ